MRRVDQYQAQQGFFTIAQNSADVDYLRLAYLQALSIKITMPGSLYAVAVDKPTLALVTEEHRRVFDYVITIENDQSVNDEWKLRNEWQSFHLTPFKETIKLESDIVFTRSIAHWWATFRLKNIVLSQGCRDYLGNTSSDRTYRQVFDDNQLPDVYSGLMYFRYSQEAAEFFWWAQQIFQNWLSVKEQLIKCHDDYPTTDVVYALAAKIVGEETCTIPGVDFINFTHMKPKINKFSPAIPWHNLVVYETPTPMVRINNINQYHPLHYQDKAWVTDELIKEYADEFASLAR
jgi:hypothetical protein